MRLPRRSGLHNAARRAPHAAACALALAAPTWTGSTTVSTPAPSDSLALILLVPDSVRAGEPVRFTLRVQNRSQRALDLYLRGRTPTLDVVLTDTAGAVVWRRFEGQVIPAIVHLRTLGPGEQFELEATWDQRTAPGTWATPGSYTARGLLLAEGEPLASPAAPFRIVGR